MVVEDVERVGSEDLDDLEVFSDRQKSCSVVGGEKKDQQLAEVLGSRAWQETRHSHSLITRHQ
jgi:hypothetical protein